MALPRLNAALDSLSNSVSNFNVGAVSISDFKPLEDQLKDVRQILKVQKSHCLLIAAKHNEKSAPEIPEEDVGTTIQNIHEDLANLKGASMAISLCLQSDAAQDILHKGRPNPEIEKQLRNRLRKLYLLNDDLISLGYSMIEARRTEMELKRVSIESALEYRAFLREQEKLRDQRLEETNPQLLRNKKRLESKLTKINVMKRLITNMIATAGNVVVEKPRLFELMSKHRDLLNIEKIIEIARERAQLSPTDS